MARGFGSTNGTGATDRLVWTGSSLSLSYSSTFTFVITYYKNGNGGTGAGRLFVVSDGTSSSFEMLIDGTTTRIRLQRSLSTTPNIFDCPSTSGSGNDNGVIYTTAVKLDDSSLTNIPTVYTNGTQFTYTRTAGSGTRRTGTSEIRFGNRAANDRVWDGWIAEFAWWNIGLSDTLMQQITAKRIAPMNYLTGLVFYAPLLRGTRNLMATGGTMTNTGSQIQQHPNMIYPD